MEDIFSQRNIIVLFIYSILAWIVGHQSSHIAYVRSGQGRFNSLLLFIMGLETFFAFAFILWFGYRVSWYLAVILFVLSFFVRLILVAIEQRIGLTQRAWVISTSGIILVPALLVLLIMIVEREFPS